MSDFEVLEDGTVSFLTSSSGLQPRRLAALQTACTGLGILRYEPKVADPEGSNTRIILSEAHSSFQIAWLIHPFGELAEAHRHWKTRWDLKTHDTGQIFQENQTAIYLVSEPTDPVSVSPDRVPRSLLEAVSDPGRENKLDKFKWVIRIHVNSDGNGYIHKVDVYVYDVPPGLFRDWASQSAAVEQRLLLALRRQQPPS